MIQKIGFININISEIATRIVNNKNIKITSFSDLSQIYTHVKFSKTQSREP